MRGSIGPASRTAAMTAGSCKGKVLLLCAALVVSGGGTDLHVGCMVPQADCPSCVAAFLSAVHHANTVTLPAHPLASTEQLTIVPAFRDSGNLTATLGGAIELSDPGGPPVDALVADLYSSRVALSARIAELRTVPMVGYGATSDAFSDKTNFPLFSRVVSPDIFSARAVVAAIQAFGWGRIGVLYSDDAYGTNYANQLSAAAELSGLVVHAQKTFPSTAASSEIELPIRQLVATGVRVIVLAAVSTDVTNALLAAGAVGATGREYTWFGADGVTSRENFQNPAGVFANGMLGVFPQYEPASAQAQTAVATVLVNRTWAGTPGVTLPPQFLFSPWAYYVWDATVLTIQGLAEAHYSGSCNVSSDGWCTQDAIRRQRLPAGATGSVALQANGDRPGSYSIVNLQLPRGSPVADIDFATVGTIDLTAGPSAATVTIARREIVWPGGDTGTLDVPSHGDFSTGEGKTSTDRRGSTVAIAASAAVVGLVLLALGVSRYQLHRALHQPEDLGELQEGMLESVGMALRLQRGECGIVLQCDGPLTSTDAESLLHSVRRALPKRLAALLKDADARVADMMPYVLVAVPRVLKQGAVEDMVLALEVSIRTLRTGQHSVVDVSVAMSKRLPAELDRRRITRVDILGQGHYGEVFKALLSQVHAVTIPAAVKSLKGDDALSREALLREAALMALCDHRNLVRLIGVVTIPRNMPLLIVMEYCEHGTLLDSAKAGEIDPQLGLTYCHDVATALSYLGSRKIVHRDVAARNVLLDAAFTAKLADMGLSAAVGGGGEDSDYSSNYIQLTGELPVRWSAIEVLMDNKFSRASDVWAFGILVHEVMSGGSTPYCEFATLPEVTEQIRAGYKLRCPEGCPRAVHEQIMLPCWASNPGARPGFTALCVELEALGVVKKLGSDYDQSMSRVGSRRGKSLQKDRNMEDRALLGTSIYHLQVVLEPQTLERVRPPWRDRHGNAVDPPESATMKHAVETVVMPATTDVTCPRDGLKGCAYVDVLTAEDDVGPATALLSYTWAYRIVSVANALVRWAEAGDRRHHSTYIWICCLCLNQHRMESIMSPSELANALRPRVVTIGRILPMLDPWDSAMYLSRAWCLFELYTAIGEGGVDIDVVLSEEQLAAFETSMACDGYGSIDRALAGIRSQDATATRPADLEAIRSLILETAGGFEQLNATVRHHLARWFERHGAVRTSVRRLTFQRTKADSLKDQSPYIEQLRSDSASRSLSGISEVPTEGDAPDGKVAASASQCVEVALAFETHI